METLHSPTDVKASNHVIVSSTLHKADQQTMLQNVRDAGIVGAGGAGFPTYVKLQSKAEIFLVNAAECEPMLKVDQQLMVQEASKLIRGLQYGMALTGAKEGIIALKEKYQQAMLALTPLLPDNIRIHVLPDIYPAGDEVITIWLATGRQVAAGDLPISIGVLVNNVQTLIQLADTLEHNKPVTKRTLTVNGAVANPITFTAPIGITLAEALQLAGGVTIPDPAFIVGGPMMGKVTDDLNKPVTKTTGGLLVLPRSHLIIKRQQQSLQSVMAMARNVCEQCKMCTELCPRHLIGHELSPSEIVKAVCYEKVSKPSILLSALTCSECGICEAYACPVEISPMRVNQTLKKQFRQQGAKYEGELREVDPMMTYRMLPTKRLVARLNLEEFNKDAPIQSLNWSPDKVTIPLQQHIGKPSNPIVTVGEHVQAEQCIATADNDALGVSIHSSITGVVSQVSDSDITITRE
ncbi:SLBB domain-containing protein [Vibrio sp. MA40-2]|uniref:SLBB domain-containing protein n=1 Tax=Vibrio sp. MA40-2 TaxID=3391828 RepID=UPI0039A65A2F